MALYSGKRAAHPFSHSTVAAQADLALAGIPQGFDILTCEGALPVETLVKGDRVISRTTGSVALLGVRCRVLETHVVEVAPNVLRDYTQTDCLILPAAQRVLLRDWRAKALFGQPQAVAPVGALVDHGFIRDLGMQEICVFDLSFTRDQVIYAAGLEMVVMHAAPQERAAA